MPMLGVISGSGMYDIPGLEIKESVTISTPYGEPSDAYRIGTLAGKEVAFLPRHGFPHRIQPHKINYRANIWGLREIGVRKIISIGASGGISGKTGPGMVTVPHQIIDMTSGRLSTFYDEEEVVHIDFTDPFCPDLRNYIFKAAERSGVEVIKSGVYICVNGPRLETSAEVRTFALWGADMVGMTAMPEASLARELGICFAGISIITNYAAGITPGKLAAKEVVENMRLSVEKLSALLKEFFTSDFSGPACSCVQALKEAKL
jgi:5'-methylthioadenosine phosphorylase